MLCEIIVFEVHGKVNEGEVQQYYITDSHPAIIPPEVFEIVQGEVAARKATGRQNSSAHCFSGKVICGECGGAYGSKVWHSNDAYRRVVWQCNRKYTKGQVRCATPHLTDEQLGAVFVKAFNQVLANKEAVLAAYRQVVKVLGDTSAFDEELASLGAEAEAASQQVRECVEENARSVQDQAVFQQNYALLSGERIFSRAYMSILKVTVSSMPPGDLAMQPQVRQGPGPVRHAASDR